MIGMYLKNSSPRIFTAGYRTVEALKSIKQLFIVVVL